MTPILEALKRRLLKDPKPGEELTRQERLERLRTTRNFSKIERDLRRRIPRPLTGMTRAQARATAKAAREAREAEIAARLTTSGCWTVLGCAPGSGYPTLKVSLAARKEELRTTGGTMDQFRLLDEALVEALERLRTGVW